MDNETESLWRTDEGGPDVQVDMEVHHELEIAEAEAMAVITEISDDSSIERDEGDGAEGEDDGCEGSGGVEGEGFSDSDSSDSSSDDSDSCDVFPRDEEEGCIYRELEALGRFKRFVLSWKSSERTARDMCVALGLWGNKEDNVNDEIVDESSVLAASDISSQLSCPPPARPPFAPGDPCGVDASIIPPSPPFIQCTQAGAVIKPSERPEEGARTNEPRCSDVALPLADHADTLPSSPSFAEKIGTGDVTNESATLSTPLLPAQESEDGLTGPNEDDDAATERDAIAQVANDRVGTTDGGDSKEFRIALPRQRHPFDLGTEKELWMFFKLLGRESAYPWRTIARFARQYALQGVLPSVELPYFRQKTGVYNTIQDVVGLLRTSTRVIVVTGAGISVSCGIPDFRSPGGVYDTIRQKYDLEYPERMFDLDQFRRDPRPFFEFSQNLYPGKYKPSPTHRFIRALERRGKLLRNYTQNIDTLERVASIERVIECHGSFATATCVTCGLKVSHTVIRDQVMKGNVPFCQVCVPEGRYVPPYVPKLENNDDDDAVSIVTKDIAETGGGYIVCPSERAVGRKEPQSQPGSIDDAPTDRNVEGRDDVSLSTEEALGDEHATSTEDGVSVYMSHVEKTAKRRMPSQLHLDEAEGSFAAHERHHHKQDCHHDSHHGEDDRTAKRARTGKHLNDEDEEGTMTDDGAVPATVAALATATTNERVVDVIEARPVSPPSPSAATISSHVVDGDSACGGGDGGDGSGGGGGGAGGDGREGDIDGGNDSVKVGRDDCHVVCAQPFQFSEKAVPTPPSPPPIDWTGVVKPDIVFFGEGLPDEFYNGVQSDESKADLVIVIGSSLNVQPVCLVPWGPPPSIPRVLINREEVGYPHEFDVMLLGDSDDVVGSLCSQLGWSLDDVDAERTCANATSGDIDDGDGNGDAGGDGGGACIVGASVRENVGGGEIDQLAYNGGVVVPR